MSEKLQIEYTYYPRWHDDDVPQDGHQGLIHEIEQTGDTITAYAAVGELTHQRLLKRATDNESINYTEVALPRGYAYPRAVIVAAWPWEARLGGRQAFVLASGTGDADPDIDQRLGDELVHKLGLGLLAAVKLSIDNKSVRGMSKYTDLVSEEALAEAEAAEGSMLAVIHS